MGGRKPAGWVRWLVFGLAVGWSLFQLYATYVGTLNDLYFRAFHLMFAFSLVFLVYPFGRRSSRRTVPWMDWVLGVVAVICAVYVISQYQQILEVRAGFGNRTDQLVGAATLVLLLLGAWRALGPAMPIIAMVFMLFAMIGPAGVFKFTLPGELGQLHGGATWNSVVNQLFMNTGDSIWGTPIGVSAETVFVFVLFGALLDRCGAGQWFTDYSYALLGWLRGGAAKASIVASALNGVVSGSSVSNVVTGGQFTISSMIRAGYSKEKAGAIEVASSSNGQLMPPVMGAAAFIMADFLQIPYASLILMAILPALLAYATLLVVADFEAAKMGMTGTAIPGVPKNAPYLVRFALSLAYAFVQALPVLVRGLHYLLPIGYLFYALIVQELSPNRAALNTIFVMLVIIVVQELVVYLRSGRGAVLGLRSGGQMILDGLETGARNMISIAVATGVAGIIIGMVVITNLGTGLADILQALSFGNILIALVLAQIISLLLGMGLPTTANYVVMASLIVPVILKLAEQNDLAVYAVQAHMFAFYFGIMADATPPVALAAYAAAAISKGDPFKTGIEGFIILLRTALLAYMIFFTPGLLLIESIGENNVITWLPAGEAVVLTATAFAGLVAFTGFTMGYLNGPANWPQRILYLGAALLLLPDDATFDWIGVGIVVLVVFWQHFVNRAGGARPKAGS
ncbi:MAG: TRAP transporter permease [Meiothermus sp.]|nr:TRAP transporter permease [Meiothermus sp.]